MKIPEKLEREVKKAKGKEKKEENKSEKKEDGDHQKTKLRRKEQEYLADIQKKCLISNLCLIYKIVK